MRKLCKRHAIPMPPADYWAEVAHGISVSVARLPAPDDTIPSAFGAAAFEPEEVADARAQVRVLSGFDNLQENRG